MSRSSFASLSSSGAGPSIAASHELGVDSARGRLKDRAR
jgi:hypothetical protein